jgi:hypothetical protein
MHIQPHIVRGSEVLQKHIGNPALAIQELFDKAICDHYKVSAYLNRHNFLKFLSDKKNKNE